MNRGQLLCHFMPVIRPEKPTVVCPRCGFLTDREFRFCQSCGAPLPETGAYVESETKIPSAPQPKRSMLAITSLILGLAALFPLGALAGIPAIALGAIVLRRRLPGLGLGLAGIALGLLGTLVTTPAVLLPHLARNSETDKLAQVQTAMSMLQESFEAWADSTGSYPSEATLSDTLPAWIPSDLPTNPYTRSRYQFGTDLFYFPDKFTRPGINRIREALNLSSPYSRLSAPESVPGTILLLGYTDPETGEVSEYGIAGFGRDITQPISEMVAVEGEVKKVKVFSVLTGQLPQADD